MLDIARLDRIHLTLRPFSQRFVGGAILAPIYNFAPGLDIRFEGQDRLPDEPVIYAMNHTDRYNYFPFQFRLWRTLNRFTATWVKGKYYESALVGKFMEMTNNIPTVSRGYLISKDFVYLMKRSLSESEYKVLRGWADESRAGDRGDPPEGLDGIPAELFTTSRNVLGYAFDPSKESYAGYINSIFQVMISRFVELNREAVELGLDLLIFPQGTRSIRLSKGHIGISQIALHLKRPIVPVGCSGSDRAHPGASPIPKRGKIVYRFGEPLHYDDLKRFWTPREFEPFSPEAEAEYQESFQALADLLMERLNGLVDPEYQFSVEQRSEGVEGHDRFL